MLILNIFFLLSRLVIIMKNDVVIKCTLYNLMLQLISKSLYYAKLLDQKNFILETKIYEQQTELLLGIDSYWSYF